MLRSEDEKIVAVVAAEPEISPWAHFGFLISVDMVRLSFQAHPDTFNWTRAQVTALLLRQLALRYHQARRQAGRPWSDASGPQGSRGVNGLRFCRRVAIPSRYGSTGCSMPRFACPTLSELSPAASLRFNVRRPLLNYRSSFSHFSQVCFFVLMPWRCTLHTVRTVSRFLRRGV